MQVNRRRNDARLDRHNRDHGLNCSRRAQGVPGHRFSGTDRHAGGMLAKAGLDGLRLSTIIVLSRGAMRVDVLDLVGMQSRLLQGPAHRSHQSRASWSRLSDVMGIACRAVAHKFGENVASPGLRKFEVFKDQHAGPFAHHKTVARRVKGAAGSLRIIVAA